MREVVLATLALAFFGLHLGSAQLDPDTVAAATAAASHADPKYVALVQSAVRKMNGPAPAPQKPCPHLTKEILQQHAREGLVLVTAVDHLVMKKFGESFIQNILRTNISYWFIAALDPWTSLHLGSRGPEISTHCFNAPQDVLAYKGNSDGYKWGSHHWRQTTWNKVHVLANVYSMGFSVVHSDTDVSWFLDPWPYFQKFMNGPVHAIFATDSLQTKNSPEAQGLEYETNPYTNINTGLYFIRQYPDGNEFFKVWLSFQPTDIGHDQDGLNAVVRGEAHTGNKKLNPPQMKDGLIVAAQHNKTLVSLFPVSMFGNAYTYGVGRVHEHVQHPLYVVHWVWSGSTMESKQQNMRDAGAYWDPPEYYGVGHPELNLVTVGSLWRPKMPEGFNEMKFEETEQMIQFHLTAINAQLQQAYYAFAAAMALNRTLVLPVFDCFCAKNWYMTQMCRINGERHTQFPFTCQLSQILRSKKLISMGLVVQDGARDRTTMIREHGFLNHPSIPSEIKSSKLVLVPDTVERKPNDPFDVSKLVKGTTADGNAELVVPWPLNDKQLQEVISSQSQQYRVIHISNATKIMGNGFANADFQKQFDIELQKMATYWCCRSPADMTGLNASDKVQLNVIPLSRGSVNLNGIDDKGVYPSV